MARSKHLSVRLSTAEFTRVTAAAESLGMTGAALVRLQALRVAGGVPELRPLFLAAPRTLHQASRGAQDAIETAIRGMGSSAVESALLLLPPEVALPVNLAERAVAHAIDRTLDLGRGLELSLGR